jgi:hypothetical protein
MTIFVLIRNLSRYPCFNDIAELPTGITLRGMVGMHPRSPRDSKAHRRMKASVQTLDGTLKCRWSRSIVPAPNSISETPKTPSFQSCT